MTMHNQPPRRVSDAFWSFLLGTTFGASLGAFVTVVALAGAGALMVVFR